MQIKFLPLILVFFTSYATADLACFGVHWGVLDLDGNPALSGGQATGTKLKVEIDGKKVITNNGSYTKEYVTTDLVHTGWFASSTASYGINHLAYSNRSQRLAEVMMHTSGFTEVRYYDCIE